MIKLLSRLLTAAIAIITLPVLHAQTFKMVKDINQQKNSNPSNTINNKNVYAVLNGKAYFAADDGVHGKELWSSDGTAAGTVLVKDINPGAASSRLSFIYNFKNKLYFFATKDGKYLQFWRSDGTAGGTVLLKDSFNVGGDYSYNGAEYAEMGSELYFTVTAHNNRDELWKTSGNAGSVQKVLNIDSLEIAANSNINDLTVYNNHLYFTAGYGRRMYVSDGSLAGTHRFSFNGSNTFFTFTNFYTANNNLYFTSDNSVWQSAGDSAGTTRITPAFGSNIYGRLKNTIYTITSQFASGFNLYKADTTAPYAYHLVKGLNTGNALINGRFVMNLGDSLLFFAANDTTFKPRLWVTDGTEAGTKLLVNDHYDFSNFFAWGNNTYFSHTGNTSGEELWVSDGSVTGTQMVADINPGIYGSYPDELTLIEDSIFVLSARHNNTGIELWKTNGTGAGTALVKDINITTTASSNPITFRDNYDTVNNRMIFVADDGIHGAEIWSSDGTSEGTFLTNDIVTGSVPGAYNGYTGALSTRFKNEEYFFAASATNNYAFWKTKGLPGTTSFVSDLYHTPGGIAPHALGTAGNNVFAQIGGASGIMTDSTADRLYSYKGSGEPLLLKTGIIRPTTISYMYYKLPAAGNNILFFNTPNTGANSGVEIWKSDGTLDGTKLIKNLYPGQYFGSTLIGYNIQYKEQAFFIANSGSNFGGPPPTEFNNNTSYLWKSDGTAEGTQIVKKVNLSLYWPLVISNNKLFFVGEDGPTGDELWVTDGTDAGTHLVKDITPGPTGSYMYSFTDLDGILYFTLADATSTTLWKSDGTEAGTVQVATHSGELVKGDHKLYFIYNDSPGYTIWQSDGTEAGTVSMGNAGIEGAADVQQLTYMNGHLYLGANTYAYGTELYRSENLLPVSMLSFTANLKNTDALLQWSTVNEQNNNYFNVQRSLNGNDFTTIGRVNALGNIKENDYNYTDAGVTTLGVSKLYYRLQQFDLDGKSTLSKTIPLTIPTGIQLQVGPNPAVDVANIYSSVSMPNAVITLTDMSCRVLYSAKQNILAGSKTAIPLRGYAKGVYTISVQATGVPKQEFKLVVGR